MTALGLGTVPAPAVTTKCTATPGDGRWSWPNTAKVIGLEASGVLTGDHTDQAGQGEPDLSRHYGFDCHDDAGASYAARRIGWIGTAPRSEWDLDGRA